MACRFAATPLSSRQNGIGAAARDANARHGPDNLRARNSFTQYGTDKAQSRLIELVDNHDGTLSIFATMVDHAGPAAYGGRINDPVSLAGLARELAANDPQQRSDGKEGVSAERNVELLSVNPLG